MYFSTDNDITQLTKKHETDAGLDICASEDTIVWAGERGIVPTGLHVSIPDGMVGLIWSRSGLSAKYGIEVGAGCIDAGYTGEVKIVLYNHSEKPFTIKAGDRIAQLLTIPVYLSNYGKVESLENTPRGSNGFGSTGVSSWIKIL